MLQNLTQVEKIFDRYDEVGERIRAIPDLLVINKVGKPSFIEVKFRWRQQWHKDDYKMLDRIKIFWNASIIFVNCYEKPYFLITAPPYQNKRGQLSGWPLEKSRDFNVTANLLKKYDILVEKYLTPTLR